MSPPPLLLLFFLLLLSYPTPLHSTTYFSIRTSHHTYTLLDTRRSTTGNDNNDVIDTRTQTESDVMVVREQSSPQGPLKTSIIILGSGNVLSKSDLLRDLTSIHRVRNLRTSYHTSIPNVSTSHSDDNAQSGNGDGNGDGNDEVGGGFWEHVISRLLYVRNRQPSSSTSSSLSPSPPLPSHTTTPPTTSTSLYPNLPPPPIPHIILHPNNPKKKITTFDSVGSTYNTNDRAAGGICMEGMVSKFKSLLPPLTITSLNTTMTFNPESFERILVSGFKNVVGKDVRSGGDVVVYRIDNVHGGVRRRVYKGDYDC